MGNEIEKIRKLGKKKNLKKLLKYLSSDLEEEVVEAVFEAIGSIKSPDAVAELCRFMTNQDARIRRMAAKALAVAASPADVEKLRHFADVESEADIKSILSEAAVNLSANLPMDDIA